MSKWPMRGHFRYLSFKTFSMTPRTLQCEMFWVLLSSSKHSGVSEDSKSATFPSVGLHPHTWPKWGCDSVVAAKEFVDQAGSAQARANVGGIGVVLDDANGQPGLADQQVGLLPCEWVGLIQILNPHAPSPLPLPPTNTSILHISSILPTFFNIFPHFYSLFSLQIKTKTKISPFPPPPKIIPLSTFNGLSTLLKS